MLPSLLLVVSLLISSTYTASLTVSLTKISPGDSVTFSWENSEKINAKDWIGIYPEYNGTLQTHRKKAGNIGVCSEGECPQGSTTWNFLCGNQSCNNVVKSPGKVVITIPSTVLPGIYYGYYLSNGGYKYLATSPAINVQTANSITLTSSFPTVPTSGLLNFTWSGGSKNRVNDWIAYWQIGHTPSEGSNFFPSSWRYTYGGNTILNSGTSSTESGTIAIQAPYIPGIYTVYYCENNGYKCPTSVTISVTNPSLPNVSCSPAGISPIKNLIIIEKENHSFDSIFGGYCSAETNSKPTSNYGSSACEKPPETVNENFPAILTDDQNMAYDPPHSQAAMTCMANNGKMDMFVTGCSSYSDPRNFAIAGIGKEDDAWLYGDIASGTILGLNSAISDNVFQSASGASVMSNMYYTIPQFMFLDDTFYPQNSSLNGARCYSGRSPFVSFSAPTIFDLLNECGVSWTIYANGWNQNPTNSQCYPDFFDITDFGQGYFPTLTKNPGLNWRDYSKFSEDVAKNNLPAVSHLRGLGVESEHPSDGTFTDSFSAINSVITEISNSDHYHDNTLIVIIDDESGGYYDHVAPPEFPNPIDGQFYGPRHTAMFIGSMVKTPVGGGYVSHKPMEVSSLIKFIEWNFMNGETGQLKGRDQVCYNIGDVLQSYTGVPVF